MRKLTQESKELFQNVEANNLYSLWTPVTTLFMTFNGEQAKYFTFNNVVAQNIQYCIDYSLEHEFDGDGDKNDVPHRCKHQHALAKQHKWYADLL